MQRLSSSQGKRLCELAHLLRPDWDLPGIEAVVRDVATSAAGIDVARALLNLAANPAAKTPGLLKHSGRHWPTDDQGQPVRTPDMPHPKCPTHGAGYPCPYCRTEVRPARPGELKEALRSSTS